MNMRTLTAPLGLLLILCTSTYAQSPVFRGPKVHDGAWENENAWGDAFEGDPAQGSYAYRYQAWANVRADEHAAARTLLDCADLSIDMLCEYAALHKLPVSWRAYYPPERRFITFDNTDRQFESPQAFSRWSKWFLGAMNLADNTDAIAYDDWAGGDMVLFDWNQSPESPNFEGRTVWHTYLIGKPDEVIYYGNIEDGEPLPVSRVTGGRRMDMVRTHPDRYGLSPRRFRVFAGKVWGPRTTREVATVIRVRNSLNLRTGPGTSNQKISSGRRGEEFVVLGRDGRWVKVQLPDGRVAWAHGYFLSVREVEIDPPAERRTGLAGALASN